MFTFAEGDWCIFSFFPPSQLFSAMARQAWKLKMKNHNLVNPVDPV